MSNVWVNSDRPPASRHEDRYPPRDDDGRPDGSFYIDLTDHFMELYGPKADGRWPTEPQKGPSARPADAETPGPGPVAPPAHKSSL